MAPYNEGRGIIYERFLFNSREQEASESLDDFVASLQKLSAKCQFDDKGSELVRDRLVVGIRSKEIQSKLLSSPDNLSLNQALEIAKSTEVAKNIKQESRINENDEDDDDMPSLHDKLHVQVNVVEKPDIRVSEEAKIAILIELLNHKAVLMAPTGHEGEKADLWEKVFVFAQSVGVAFRSALHLREVFGSWKNLAIQAKHNVVDVKMSSCDKLIWDLLGQDESAQLEDYPSLPTAQEEVFDNNEEEEEEEYEYEENDLDESSSTSEEEDLSDEDYAKPAKRGRGRPRRESPVRSSNSMSMPADLRVIILKKLLVHKDIVASRGQEKEKKELWRNLYNSLESKLNSVGSASALRGAFRIWKMRSMKKKDNPDETLTESDRLIYQIFDIEEPMVEAVEDDILGEVKEESMDEDEEEKDQDSGLGCINHETRLEILHELAKHRGPLGMNHGSVYEKESAWREVHARIGVKNLSIKKMKELIRFWQAKAFHTAVKLGGPVTSLQRLMYHAYNIDKNAAAPFANMENGCPPQVVNKIPGCTHFSPEAKIAIIKELLRLKRSDHVVDKDMWEKATNVAIQFKVANVTTQKLKYLVKQWKYRVQRMLKDGQSPKTKAEKLLFDLYDLRLPNAIEREEFEEDVEDVNIDEASRAKIVSAIEINPTVLCQRAKEPYKKVFWSKVLSGLNIEAINCKRAFMTWPEAGPVIENLKTGFEKAAAIPENIKTALLNQIFQNQAILHFGLEHEQRRFWDALDANGPQMALIYTMWKEELLEKMKKGQYQLRPSDRMILEISLGQHDLSVQDKHALLPLIKEASFNGDSKSKMSTFTEILSKVNHITDDPLSLFKMAKRWKLKVLKKQEFSISLDANESSLVENLGIDFGDSVDADLLSLIEDTSAFDHKILQIFVPMSAKNHLANSVASKHDLVFGSNFRDIAAFWVENLEATEDAICPRPQLLQRAFFAWIFEAWHKRITNNDYLTQFEATILDLAIVKKASDFDFSESVQDDILDVSEEQQVSIITDLMEFKHLMQVDKALFWTLALKIAQAFGINCDSPSKLFMTFLTWRLKVQQRIISNIPLIACEKILLEFFGLEANEDPSEDDGDDVFEDDNLWHKLTADISVKARMAILDTLNDHKDIVATSKRNRWDNDRIAVWQKTLNVAIEEGVKVENHSKLMKMVREWREQAKRSLNDGIDLEPWEEHLLQIFDPNSIKEEVMEDSCDQSWIPPQNNSKSETAASMSVPEAIKLVIAKAMIRHHGLIFSESETDQLNGWRKVFRIAQGNGAFYDNIGSMRESISHWKSRALAKLNKDPSSIGALDKLMFTIYSIDTGDLNFDDIGTNIKHEEIPVSRLTTGGQMAVLEEMLRNLPALRDEDHGGHKRQFYAWSNVLLVGNAVGGNFPTLVSLTHYVKNQLKSPTEIKIRNRAKINEIDMLVAKIYGLDTSGLEFESEHNVSIDTQHGCRMCQVQFMRFDELRIHQQMIHGQMPEVDIAKKCRICGYDVGVDKAAMRVHMRTFHPQEPFFCDHCDQVFMNDPEYYVHVATHVEYNPMETLEELSDASDDEKAVPLSSAKQKRKGVYRKRVKIELPMPSESDELPKIGKKEGGLCPHCGEYYKHVQQHIMYKHETKKPWKCDQCDYAHALQKGLQEHVRNCHPKESDLKVCHICGYKTTLNHNLKEHIERTHEKKRRFTCNLCDAHFYRKNVMERHVRVKHMGESPFKCKSCGQAFKNRDSMVEHEKKVHEGVTYRCYICGNMYSSSKTVKRHVNTIHLGHEKKSQSKKKKPAEKSENP